jgi:membrane protein implicated in regulation of membrane protease activity
MVDILSFVWILWSVVGIGLILSEFLVPGFVVFFFGLGSLVTALLTGLLPGLQSRVPLQILIFLASSGLSLAFLRRYFSKVFRGRFAGEDEPDEYLGSTVTVVERIAPEKPGRIRYQGTTWSARSYTEELEEGQKVQIIDRDNLTFVVTKSISGELTDGDL